MPVVWTEGVDVPTIDLVAFHDPKNSKVDIVQAVKDIFKDERKRIYCTQYTTLDMMMLKVQ